MAQLVSALSVLRFRKVRRTDGAVSSKPVKGKPRRQHR